MKITLFFCVLLTGSLFSGTLFAQNTQYRFVNYHIEDGLPDKYGKCGFLDSRGILWIGTEDGLASFDGTEFTNYFHQDSVNSLPKNFITDIAEDKHGQLWISTSGGLCRFDPYTGTFHNVLLKHEEESGFPGVGTGHIFIGKNGLLWITSYRGGFFSYDPKTRSTEQYTLPGYRVDYARDTNTAHRFAQDPTDPDILWVTARNGLYRLNKKTGDLEHLIDSKPIPYNGISYTMHEMYFRKPHELWIGGWGCGLKRYNTQTGEVESFYYGKKTGARSSVLDFSIINDSLAWVATQNAGVGFFNFNTGKYRLLPVEPDDPYGIQATNVNTIVPVGNGQAWFITYGKGISLYDPANQGFSFTSLPKKPLKRSFDFAVDTVSKKVYIASRPSNYMHVYDYQGKLIDKIPLKGGPEKTQNSFAITIDHAGEVWIVGNNVFRYDPKTKTAKLYRPPEIDSIEKARRRGYLDIEEDTEGNLWFFGIGGGLFRIDSSRKKVESFERAEKAPQTRFNNLHIRDIYIGKDKKVWIVHEYGLTSYNPKTKKFTFHPDTDWGNGIDSWCMVEVKENVFWVGTHFNGLLKLVEKNGTLILKKRITRSDGLPSGLAVSMDVDKKGQLWLATSKGVVNFDPATGRKLLYGKEEGIRYPYIDGEVNVLENHKLYVSNLGGFCVLDLKEDKDLKPPKVILKNIQVFGKSLVFDTLPNFKHTLRLDYDQDFFTIKYAGLAFSQPEKLRYAYKLEGYDKKWVNQPATGNLAVYTGVPPGEYIFQVMAANANGSWGKLKKLRILIDPPFWETWWFYVLCAVAVIGILLYLSHLRSQRVRRKERVKADFEKQLANMELTALRAQMNPHFIFNCLNSIKHLVVTGSNDEATDYLMNFANLIRMVLDNSTKERISLSEELKMTKAYVKMEKLRFDDRFSFSLKTDPALDLELVELPPLILQPFVENAIWHGLMHKEGAAKLTIDVEEDSGMLLCIIDDNGIGREKARDLKSKSATKKKSYGLKLAGNRLKLYNKLKESKVKIDLKIIDKFEDENKPSGTTVLLKIPLWKT